MTKSDGEPRAERGGATRRTKETMNRDEEMQNETMAVRDGFAKMYESNPPWDIGKPQAAFRAVADQMEGPVLDAGCGTGNTSVYLAAKGLQVTGIDFVDEAIRRARAKAAERELKVDFRVTDAMTLGAWTESFASVVDSGLFHIYEGKARKRYVDGLANVVQRDGRLYLLCFSSEEPLEEGGISREELEEVFAEGWEIESLEAVRGEVNPEFLAEHPKHYGKGGPLMWFAIVRRTE